MSALERGAWLATLRELARPRRAIPTLAVVIALVSTERLSGWSGVWVALSMSLVFVLFGPPWWCWLFATKRTGPVWLRSLLYLGGCVLMVALLGWALPVVLSARSSALLDDTGLPVTAVLFVVGGWGLGRDVNLERGLRQAEARGARLAREVEHARLLAVRRQLDPHFLFNTLNAIAEWCSVDPQIAETATLRLAKMLRDMLKALERERWPLAEELLLVEQLFELHRVRDPAKLTIALSGALDCLSEVPTLLLLPLAENAMTHGPRAGHAGEVSLHVTADAQLRIVLENPGTYQGPRAGGHGLASVRQRLSLAYGDAAALTLETVPGAEARTRMTLVVPKAMVP